MSGDDIIRLAVEARLVCNWDGGCASAWVEGHDLTPYLERFAALVAAAEREAIAQMIEDAPPLVDFCKNEQNGCLVCGFTPKFAAAAIRARGKK